MPSTKISSKSGSGNGTSNGLEAITKESEPETVVAVVKTGKKSGKVGVDFSIPQDGMEAEDYTAVNQRLKKAGIPLVVLPETHEVAHTRTGLVKDASECHFWVTPDKARISEAAGR